MSCFTCGKGIPLNVNAALRHFKAIYEKNGTERYFYKLGENEPVLIVRKMQFKEVFKNQIKKNLKHGATYAHISEYNPTAG